MARVHDLGNSSSSRAKRGVAHGLRTIVHHFKRHVGVGIVCSVAYFDPGNWSVDLQAGSSFGYRPMLFVVLMAGLGAIVLQARTPLPNLLEQEKKIPHLDSVL
ncbi:hypothetical protein M413DRAFT_228780 [Hebeloma cylindrosporum]|uniref:Uncharacterized protein n=1 Tax=Hebeloma cylindrosporum TaxID=76867 RepID=A0A0C2YEY7_HEBCY|nr:hypothetical protein M413DRAFT_228780 [Hebeloma cylindrosporum h7]